ncbi:hypothetical protein JL193_05010 [Polaribacter batillariae]|uniref:Uncharacterized protein n=1 Tax=Polaribacter batillariae TaxID=2808900 RepID=A0ABX7T0N0_9FLAO|nr:hypothetical protein [Polaribacter batillariae]QTD38638.1 hypothetical protein JL193_05010 [Polaribacter batillariae]
MKQHKKAALVGLIFVLIYFCYDIYHIIRISKGFSFEESLLPELVILFINQLLLIAPAVVLFIIKSFKKKYIFAVWLYPIILALGFINILVSNDPLAAGLPMVFLVFPACIILAILYFLFREKDKF